MIDVKHFDDGKPVSEAGVQALEWSVRINGPMGDAGGQEELETWLSASHENREAYAEVEQLWNRIGDFVERHEQPSAFKGGRLRAAAISEYNWSFTPYGVICAAASLCFFVLLYTMIFNDRMHSVEAFRTAIGEMREIVLQDGSQLILNTDTQVEVKYTNQMRLIEVARGQAGFVVAHEADRAFVVVAGDNAVRATGTEFDVYKSDSAVSISLLEGSVAVAHGMAAKSNLLKKRSLKHTAGAGFLSLAVGDRVDLSVSSGEVVAVEQVDLSRTRAWRSGKIIFHKTPLSEAIDEIGRYTPVQIQLLREDLSSEPVSGAFQTDDIEGFLSGLETLFGFEVTNYGNRVTLR